jgi:ABC-2 type transport system ATP-binding protein
VVTTQYVTEAEYCDQIAVLRDGRLVAVGPPEQSRQDAIGGEVVQVSGADLVRAELALRRVEGVRDVSRAGNRREGYRLVIVVDDAGRAIPEMVDAFRQEGVDVDQIEEQHANFDDVFVRLMEDSDARVA